MKNKKPKLNEKFWLAHARSFYLSQPFATKVYVAMKTKLPISFIQKHWDKISKQ